MVSWLCCAQPVTSVIDGNEIRCDEPSHPASAIAASLLRPGPAPRWALPRALRVTWLNSLRSMTCTRLVRNVSTTLAVEYCLAIAASGLAKAHAGSDAFKQPAWAGAGSAHALMPIVSSKKVRVRFACKEPSALAVQLTSHKLAQRTPHRDAHSKYR